MNSLFTPFNESVKKYIDYLYINNGMIALYSKLKNGDNKLEYYDKNNIDELNDESMIYDYPLLEVQFKFANTGKLWYMSNHGKLSSDKVGKILYDCSQNTGKKQLYVMNDLVKENTKEIYEKLFTEGKAHKISYMNNGKEEVSYMITENKRIMFA